MGLEECSGLVDWAVTLTTEGPWEQRTPSHLQPWPDPDPGRKKPPLMGREVTSHQHLH